MHTSSEDGEVDSDFEQEIQHSKKRNRDDPDTEKTLNKIRSIKSDIRLIKEELDESKHKLEKIERALKKAKIEKNQSNIEKCQKFIIKYNEKRDGQIAELKVLRSRLNKLKKSLSGQDEPEETDSRNKSKKAEQANLEMEQDTAKGAANVVIKLPYPVLNDKRDINVILSMLDKKMSELNNKLNSSHGNINQTFQIQKERLEKQMEYIRLSLNIQMLKEQIKHNPNSIPNYQVLLSNMTQQLNDLYSFMKQENKAAFMKLQKRNQPESTSKNDQANIGSQENSSNKSQDTSAIENQAKSEMAKLNSLYESMNNSLVALLAHTAATAHSTAAISIYNYNYYSHYQKQLPDEPKPEIVPIKEEFKKASTSFASFKNKITDFLKNIKTDTVEKKPVTALNKLIADYSGDEQDSEDEPEQAEDKLVKIVECLKGNRNQSANSDEKNADENDDLDSDYNCGETDLDYDCDLEIVTTSELKNSSKDYLVPSLKASYFPLKASFDYSSNQTNVKYRNFCFS